MRGVARAFDRAADNLELEDCPCGCGEKKLFNWPKIMVRDHQTGREFMRAERAPREELEPELRDLVERGTDAWFCYA